MPKEKIINIPNFLSFYRIVLFPFVLWLSLNGEEKYFAIFLCINLITDILDGFIARTFNLKTEFGARLDSIADVGTYILAFVGILKFKLEQFNDTIWMLWLLLILFILSNMLSIIKFRKFPSLHLYSMKVGGYAQGIFFFVLFAWQFNQSLYVVAMILGYISFSEEIVVLLLLKNMKSNAKGLFWVLKKYKMDSRHE